MAEKETTRKSDRRTLLLAGLVLALLVAAAAVILLTDPFGWNLLDKASGLRDEAAAAMPPDVGLYAGIDLLTFGEERLTEFSQPFVIALAEPGVDDLAGGLERLDALLDQEIGLTLTNDVMPWLGRSVGLAVTDLALRPDGSVDRVGWLLVAGTRDREAADDFLDRLGEKYFLRSGAEPNQTEYRGRTITEFQPQASSELGGLAFTRSAGLVILAPDAATVKAAMDAQRGESLADEAMFQTLTDVLPDDRGLTLYADQARLPELSRLLAGIAPLAVGPLDLSSLLLPPGALGVSIVEEGLRLDAAMPADEDETGQARTGQMIGQLPQGSLVVVTGDSLDAIWDSLKASLAAGGNLVDFEESMALLNREFRYDPDQVLLPLLDDEWALVLLPAEQGLLVELTDQPLGVVLLAGGKDGDGLAEAVDELSQSLAGQRLPLATADINGVTATTVDLDSLIGAPLPLYGVEQDVFFLGSDAENLAQVLAGGGSPSGRGDLAEQALVNDASYQAAKARLADDYQVSAYVDVTALLAQLDGAASGTMSRLLTPLRQAIAGSGPAADGVRSSVAFILIE